MATVPVTDGFATDPQTEIVAQGSRKPLAVCLPSMPSDDLGSLVQQLRQIFAGQPLLIATPDQAEEQAVDDGVARLVPYPVQRAESEWVLNAADYVAAARLMTERGVAGVMLLGTDARTLNASTLVQMQRYLQADTDLCVPQYRTGPEEALVNSSLFYPVTRALYGLDVHFPLPLDAALSARMLNRLSIAATRTGAPLDDSLVWPVAEAALAGFSVRQVEGAERTLPHPQQADLNVLFPAVTGSLFADLEAKATFWQRGRSASAARPFTPAAPSSSSDGSLEEIRSLVENFRIAFGNLREIWSLVLPPQTLVQLKKLSATPAESFAFPPAVWARVVYDFALAYRMRTLNRGHLLGALTPLYLAWVASLLREVHSPAGSGALLESTAAAFEQERPYLVSRWRWPDRFNP